MGVLLKRQNIYIIMHHTLTVRVFGLVKYHQWKIMIIKLLEQGLH